MKWIVGFVVAAALVAGVVPQAGSLRADANFDGLIDARDLESAMTSYERQGD